MNRCADVGISGFHRSRLVATRGADTRLRVVCFSGRRARDTTEKRGPQNPHPGRGFRCANHAYLKIWVHGRPCSRPGCPRSLACRCTSCLRDWLHRGRRHLHAARRGPGINDSRVNLVHGCTWHGVRRRPRSRHETGTITLRMQVKGKRPLSDLITVLSSIEGVHEVSALDDDTELD
jgi:hypothetical protein